jgi:predicted NBD/HSP70 family sugar kinase
MKIIALDIGGTSIKVGETEDGALLSCTEYDTYAKEGGEYVMNRAVQIISRYEGFEAIGISTAGQVDSRQGSIRFANENIPGYTGMQVKRLMENKFGVPCAVENDVNSAAIGEAQYGAGKDFSDFLCLTYGTGIGGAIVINRKIYSGSAFSAGEFGHLITHAAGLPCGCGLRGCYECYASTSALVRLAMALDPTLVSGRKIFENRKKPEIQKVIDHWIEEILFGITSLIHIFNPACIILGGGIMNEPYVIQKLQSSLPGSIMPSYENVVLKQAQLGNRAGLLGASFLASQCKPL